MTARRVLRYEIPVDDKAHPIPRGPVLMVTPWRLIQTSPAGRVEVWIETEIPDNWPNSDPSTTRDVVVVGTGQLLPDGSRWLGSCLDGPMVWHLYELAPEEGE